MKSILFLFAALSLSAQYLPPSGGGGAPSGPAGGILGGTYPNPTLPLTNGHVLFGVGGVATDSSLAAAGIVTQTGNPIIPTSGLLTELVFNWANYLQYSQALDTTSGYAAPN